MQIPLQFPVDSRLRREDLVVTPANAAAVAHLDSWPKWPGRLTILYGPPGSGKSHMARIWAIEAGAKALALNALRVDHLPLIADTHLLLEDAAPGEIDGTTLFHVLNALRVNARDCLITARYRPVEWVIETADLASRLRAGHLAEILQPDDLLLTTVMVKLFADRQLQVAPDVISFLVRRMERSLDAAATLVETMDRMALARASGPTRTVAAAALAELGMG